MQNNINYPLFFANYNIEGEIINISIKTWAKGATDCYNPTEKKGIQGKIKQVIYDLLKQHRINLYIIDLSLKDKLINERTPTFMKINVMFNSEGHFNENKIGNIINGFNEFLASFETIVFNRNKDELN